MLCALLEVAPVGLAITAPFVATAGAAGSELPRGALVLSDGRCADGSLAVELISTPRWYRHALDVPREGARGCVSADALRPPEAQFLVQEDAWPLRRGELVGLGGLCETWTVDGQVLSREALAALRPISPRLLAEGERVQSAYQARFGPLNLADVPIADTGFVGLPLPLALEGDEIRAAYAAEGLDTLERQQKADLWWGGEVDGRPSYAHFLGADPLWSDLWATPATIVQVLELSAAWSRACPLAATAPERCLLQVGDLAWFDDVLPDPLGHRDHHSGACVDLRLFRDDGSRYEASWNRPDDRPGVSGGYDRELTTHFLRWVTSNWRITTVLFGDPALRRAVPVVRRAPRHDDHIHLCF